MKRGIALMCLCLAGCGGNGGEAKQVEARQEVKAPPARTMEVPAAATAPAPQAALQTPAADPTPYEELKSLVTSRRRELQREEENLARGSDMLQRLHRYQVRLAELDLTLEDWREKGMPREELADLRQLVNGVLAERWSIELLGPGQAPERSEAAPVQLASLAPQPVSLPTDTMAALAPAASDDGMSAEEIARRAVVHIEPPRATPSSSLPMESAMGPVDQTMPAQTLPPVEVEETVMASNEVVMAEAPAEELLGGPAFLHALRREGHRGDSDKHTIRKPLGQRKIVRR